MIDIDHFKTINDRLGHAAGDRVLQNVAAIFRAEKRDSDVTARVGGEEFAIMLPETPELKAAQFAEQLRRRIRERKLIICGERVRVTVSIGIAGASITTSKLESLMQQADQAI
jgi:diguanylate cyclase (GGDEF)-like protein